MVVSLVDIVPRPEKVEVQPGVMLEVRGLSVEAFAQIFARFPDIAKVFAQRQFDAAQIIAAFPRAVAAVIAAGVGRMGDEKQEAAALQIPLGVQTDLLAAIVRLTMPRGVGAFLDQINGLMPGAADAALRKAQATK